jgi:tRNA(fMet)-specific endonuclease VapC
MNGYLLDTSICVALFRGNKDVALKINSVGKSNCFINDIVVAELIVGAYKSERTEENLKQVNKFMSSISVIPLADTIHEFAKERVRLWNAGNKIEDFDLLIGTAAKAKGLTMVTHNAKHFEHIEGIVIEDWIGQV